ncbi:conserved hypothetical protein [Frankia sp. Hr75.2]|nr:conserved hypothetical protein [Frankia sp. Hr75.2]
MSGYEEPAVPPPAGPFTEARVRYFALEALLAGAEARSGRHDEVEELIDRHGREVLRALFQGHLDLRAREEERADPPPVGADGVTRTRTERGHDRRLVSQFGQVTVSRHAYRAAGVGNLHPADAALNLPAGLYSHTLARRLALEVTRGSFGDAVDAVARATGQVLGKRLAVELVRGLAADVDAFYAQARPEVSPAGRLLVLQFDGKGIVMRPEALRPATAKAAGAATHRLSTRLSPGEKANRKRMAEIAVVHDITPAPRTVDDVIARRPRSKAGADETPQPRADGPKATGKWLTASVVDDIATVITAGFDEAERRDPHHQRTWVVLVDGNNTQIEAIRTEATRRKAAVTIVVDFVHVLEYIWTAAWSFFDKGDPDAEDWVHAQARGVLAGRANAIASGFRRRATRNHYNATERKGADTAADYLDAKASYLRYDLALANGWPIATGVVEGSCRHLVKDRFDITGARWGLDGAEAVLLLRAVVTNGDFDAYWAYHLDQEQHRNHHSKFAETYTPT